MNTQKNINQRVVEELEKQRRDLLDLSVRNRLIHMNLQRKSRTLLRVMPDKQINIIFKQLVFEKQNISFKGLSDLQENKKEILHVTSNKKSDLTLNVNMQPEDLHTKLLDLHRESKVMVEEQGINMLYLALGGLNWKENTPQLTTRFAPLILIPVELQRTKVNDVFKLVWREEDIEYNLSLAELLKKEFKIDLPQLTQDEGQEIDLEKYLNEVNDSISGMKEWHVDPNAIVLGFFSFAKYLMYKDLDEKEWPLEKNIIDNSLLNLLLGNDLETSKPVVSKWENISNLDDKISTENLTHVIDADPSQTIAIELVREGHNLVIQGPPGTGKSQTIVNLISTAVLDGKKILFLAEKITALDVVFRRLKELQLDAFCLELHSSKVRKSVVVEELNKVWSSEISDDFTEQQQIDIKQLEIVKGLLSKHISSLHKTDKYYYKNPYFHVGVISKFGNLSIAEQSIDLPNLKNFSDHEVDLFLSQIKDLNLLINKVGGEQNNPFRGVKNAKYVSIIEKNETLNILNSVQYSVNQMLIFSKEFINHYFIENLQVNPSIRFIKELIECTSQINKKIDIEFNNSINLTLIAQNKMLLTDLIKNATSIKSIKSKYAEILKPTSFDFDVSEIISIFNKNKNNPFRLIGGSYRKAKKNFFELLNQKEIKGIDNYLEVLSGIKQAQELNKDIEKNIKLIEGCFGEANSIFNYKTNPADIINWLNSTLNLGLGDKIDTNKLNKDIKVNNNRNRFNDKNLDSIFIELNSDLKKLSNHLKIDWFTYFNEDDVNNVDLNDLLQIINEWKNKIDSLDDWILYLKKRDEAINKFDCKSFLEYIAATPTDYKDVENLFLKLFSNKSLKDISNNNPEIMEFLGNIHSSKVDDFIKLDKERIRWAVYQTLKAHKKRMPIKAGIGSVKYLLGEINKKRAIKPIRQILKNASDPFLKLKPVLMMSPLSVAQFITPGEIEFDLLIIDEASQVKPIDALGAIARSKQIVVVGDKKQLPPTSFFDKLLLEQEINESNNEENEDFNVASAKEFESILSLCEARGFKTTMLNWHYRSKHESLIAVSNKEFYDNRLNIIPSPQRNKSNLGLFYNHVPGIYDRGGSSTNIIEAQFVAKAVMDHAINNPDQSLLVATFSMAQRKAIFDELDRLRINDPRAELFFSSHPNEPFDVKSLENVQGDERSVVFISVGYGRDKNNKFTTSFGPVNKDGGERRLNVLFSRAKSKCVVFSSISYKDFDLSSVRSNGIRCLIQFLKFAEEGSFIENSIQKEYKLSYFEDSLKEAIEIELGYKVESRIGQSGFFVDLAIVDPTDSNKYILGIECDGESYASSLWARERDRLRLDILKQKGWSLHFVWCIDFLKNKKLELEKIRLKIDSLLSKKKAKANRKKDLEVSKSSDKSSGRFQFINSKPKEDSVSQTQNNSTYSFSVPYKITILEPCIWEPYSLGESSYLKDICIKIITTESPIHFDEIVNRARVPFGFERAGGRFRQLINSTLEKVIDNTDYFKSGEFYYYYRNDILVRNRELLPQSSRKPEFVSIEEIELCILNVLKVAAKAEQNEIFKLVNESLGFGSLRETMRGLLVQSLTNLVLKGQVGQTADGLYISKSDS